jgi:hypothetical protein
MASGHSFYLDGKDLRTLPLIEREELFERGRFSGLTTGTASSQLSFPLAFNTAGIRISARRTIGPNNNTSGTQVSKASALPIPVD